MKTELQELQNQANEIIEKILETIRTATAEKPLTLFSEDDENIEDEIYEFPYGFFVSKHSYYVQGQVMTVKGDDVTLFLTGEDWGEHHEMGLNELPIESLIGLLEFID